MSIEKHIVKGILAHIRVHEIFADDEEILEPALLRLKDVIDKSLYSIYPGSFCVDLIRKGGQMSDSQPAFVALVMTHEQKVQKYAESVEKVIGALSSCLEELYPNSRAKISAEIFVKARHHIGNH